MKLYSELPTQTRADIDECAIAFNAGGKNLAARTFRAVCEARKLTRSESVILSEYTRHRLRALGLLPIGCNR